MSLQDKLKAMMGQKTEEQLAAGAAFLAENGARPEVITTASGLQYEVLETGNGGVKPGPSSFVTVHYEGRLTDGKVFDSSYKRNQPATFGVHQVISGWTEGLQLMEKGAKWRLFIPSNLGYGARGAGGSIPPNAALVFDVELIDVK